MKEQQSAIAKEVRGIVHKLLEDGSEPGDVSFVLSMVATELGLEITEGNISVFPVVLAGVSQGVSNAMEAEKDKEVEKEGTDFPAEELIH